MTYDPSTPVMPAVGPDIRPIDSHDKPAVKPADDDQNKADMPPPTGVKRPPVVQPVNGDMPAVPRHANSPTNLRTNLRTNPRVEPSIRARNPEAARRQQR